MRNTKIFCLLLLLTVTGSRAQNVSYSSLYNNSSFGRTIDLARPVGAIEGKAAALPSGAVAYTTPVIIRAEHGLNP